MSGGSGVEINPDAVEHLAERMPADRANAAANRAARLPSGHIFGSSPAGSSLAETWRLAAEHHRVVTTRLQEDLADLRQALLEVVSNTQGAESEIAARYAQATERIAATAEQSSTVLETSTEEFVEANSSDVADELAAQHGEQSTADGGATEGTTPGAPDTSQTPANPYGPSGEGGSAADGPGTTPYGPATSPSGATGGATPSSGPTNPYG